MTLDLFDPTPALARHGDPDTSHDAARTVDTSRLEALVLNGLRAYGPQTSHQLAVNLGLSLVSVSPRLKPLVSKGLVRVAGREGKRTLWQTVA